MARKKPKAQDLNVIIRRITAGFDKLIKLRQIELDEKPSHEEFRALERRVDILEQKIATH